jgi:ferredoxin-NADP reductase
MSTEVIEVHCNAERAETSPNEPVPVRLVAIGYAAADINILEFEPVEPVGWLRADPGAHVDLHLPGGVIRQYSLLPVPAASNRFAVGVKRDPRSRGGSRFIHDELRVGAILNMSGPRNNFPLVENAVHSVFIAGGIGITPIIGMIERLSSLGRAWTLHYGVARRAELGFIDEFDRAHVHLHVDEEAGGRLMNVPGIVSAAPADAHLYCCGPAPMLDVFERAAREARDASHIHIERFASDLQTATDGGFVVELARSARRLPVKSGCTILETLREAGIGVQASCEQGICGTCETRVLAGIPDHRDTLLSPEEKAANNTMMVCCSGSRSEVLVLDL